MSDREAAAADALSALIQPLLAGKSPQIQGAALADLTAMWLSGHLVLGNPAETADLRRALFEEHIDAIWGLVEHYERR